MPAHAATAVNAGALRAEVDANPWHLTLTDARGKTVLSELTATGSGPSGALGFRTAAGWQHATSVVSDARTKRAYTARLATTDPDRAIELRLSRAVDGVIALDAVVTGPGLPPQAVGVGFGAREGEHYFGFGERSNAVDQGGMTVENYVSDGPYQSTEYPLINLVAPPWGLRDGHADATYFPVPWLLSSAGYGVLVDNPETSYFRLGTDGPSAWSVEVTPTPEGGETGAPVIGEIDHLALRFFAGPRPADALRRFTDATGRQPKPASPWVLGPWYQADDDDAAEIAALRSADAPLSALQTYTHYLPCGDQFAQGDAETQRVEAAHGAGLAITTYFNPMICANYQPAYQRAVDSDALTLDSTGSPYLYRYGADVDQAFFVSQFDFTAQAGRDRYAELLDEAVAVGYDGWMEDFGEYTPLDSVTTSGVPGTSAHNPYPTDYHCAAYAAVKGAAHPVVRFQRSGWTGSAPCAQVVWGGDPTTDFGFDGLRSAVTQALSAGASGIGIWGSDIGGFFALGGNSLSPELLTRWVQLGAVSPVMRTQANGVAVPSRPRPQVLDPDQIDNWRRYTKLHTQLYPYLRAALATYRKTGLPIMRQLGLVYPDDARAAATTDEFLFGPDLLAAPVLYAFQTSRDVYLPRGRWIDLWRSAAYVVGTGSIHLRKPKVLKGRRSVFVPAPLDELPLMVRVGAILPMLVPEVDSLAPYVRRGSGLQGLADVRRDMRLLAFPRGRSTARLGGNERITSAEKGGTWRLSFRGGHTTRRYDLEAAMATLKHPFVPCALELDDEPIKRSRWSVDRHSGVLKARFTTRAGTLKLLPCL
jgi:alpha-glucosidase (family GH31 glycosyl hydrolase)